MKNYYLLLSFLLFGVCFNGFNQKIIILNTAEISSQDHDASEKVELISGYSTTSPFSMHAWIDATSPKSISAVPYGNLFDNTTFENRAINTNLPVGKIKGNTDVSASGSTTYNIPISLPSGTNGITPQLSINYNSQSTKGLLGTGWNLGGLSKIYRVSKNLYNDGTSGTISMDPSDALELDGNRLILLSGSPDLPNAVYTTERESFNKITSRGTQGVGPDWFEVNTKDGMTLEYGRTPDAVYNPKGQLTSATWLLNKASDQYGNFYTYHYRSINDETHLHKIVYQSTTVVFNYSKRSDESTYYFANSPFKEGYVINSIEILNENRLVKKYEFSYAKELYTFLTEIKEVGSDYKELNSTIFNYGTKHNGFTEVNILRSILTPSNGLSSGKVVWPGDYDGDGKTDLISLNYDIIGSSGGSGSVLIGAELDESMHTAQSDFGSRVAPSSGTAVVWQDWSLFINQGNSNFTEVSSGNSFPTGFEAFDYLNLKNTSTYGNSFIQNLDFNGDGMEDIIFTVFETDGTNDDYKFYPYLSNGNGFTAQTSFTETVVKPTGLAEHIVFSLRYLDVDGDGKRDILTHKFPFKYNGINSNITALSGRPPSITIRFDGDDSNPRNIIDRAVSFNYKLHHNSSKRNAFALDLNGNGKSELVDIYDHVNDNFVALELDHNNQFTFTSQTEKYEGAEDIKERYFGDFNADGKSDYIEQQIVSGSYANPVWHLEQSTGISNTFAQKDLGTILQHPGNFNQKATHFALDMNGDGKTDIVEVEGNGYSTPMIHVLLNNGSEFIKSTFQLPHTFDPRSPNEELDFGDFNGDGNIDILVDRGLSQGIYIYYFEKEDKQRLLHGISDGHNNITKFEYDFLTNDLFYTKGTSSTYPVVDIQAPMAVTSSLIRQDGIGGLNTTTFKYEGARVHYEGKGFLGFEKVTSENDISDIKK
ncbi:MAG: VCBS repeat-containing protein, partial [Flavobacteriales bacterium]|nr:VCBS repeat-containing protein [Flavobacteriales bacterium]